MWGVLKACAQKGLPSAGPQLGQRVGVPTGQCLLGALWRQACWVGRGRGSRSRRVVLRTRGCRGSRGAGHSEVGRRTWPDCWGATEGGDICPPRARVRSPRRCEAPTPSLSSLPLFCPQFAMWVDAVIFVFSLEDEISFQTVYHYYSRMANYRNTGDIPLVLVGTQGEWRPRAGSRRRSPVSAGASLSSGWRNLQRRSFCSLTLTVSVKLSHFRSCFHGELTQPPPT